MTPPINPVKTSGIRVAQADETPEEKAPEGEKEVKGSDEDGGSEEEESPKVEESKTEEDRGLRDWVFRGTARMGATDNGKNEGTLFAIRSWGELGDFTHNGLSLSALWSPGTKWVRFGPKFQFDSFRGSEKVQGADITSLSVGPVFELNLRHLWSGDFSVFPRIRTDFQIGYAWGDMPAQTIRLFDQGGAAYVFNAEADVLSYRIGNLEISAGAYFQSHVTDGSEFNSPFNSVGGYISFQNSDSKMVEQKTVTEKAPPPEIKEVEVCPNSKTNIEAYGKEINGDGSNPGLLKKIADAEQEVAALRQHIETRKIDPLDVAAIRDILREQKVEQLVAGGTDKTVAEAKAKEIYPDDYNHWESITAAPDSSLVTIPDTLPEDCDELAELEKKLKEGTEKLEGRLADLERLKKTPFPPRIREVIQQTISNVLPNLAGLNFRNNRPKDDQVKNMRRYVAKLKKYEEAGDTSSAGYKKYMKAFRKLMADVHGKSNVDPVLSNISTVKDALNTGPMAEVKEIEIHGHTSLRGGAKANKALSKRRAQWTSLLLYLSGVDGNRLKTYGHGEEEPLDPDEEKYKDKQEKAQAEANNRRIEIRIPESEFKRVEGLTQPTVNTSKTPGNSGGKVAPIDIDPSK